jgi:hypothetical protein
VSGAGKHSRKKKKMIQSKEELIKSVMVLAKKYNEEKGFEHLLTTCPLPRIVKDIVYLLFENDFTFDDISNHDEYVSFANIQLFVKELKQDGTVSFDMDGK